MKSPLRILFLEDNHLDVELVESTLAAAGIKCELNQVVSREQYIAALDTGAYDLIFVDYTLPAFDGMTALRIARQRCPMLPFIFVSGTMGEEFAIESLKSGATDYVLKDNLKRIAPAVRRALKEAQEKHKRLRAEEALRRAHKELEMRVKARTSELEGLLEFSSNVNRVTTSAQLFELAFKALSRIVPFDLALAVMRQNERSPSVFLAEGAPVKAETVQRILEKHLGRERGGEPALAGRASFREKRRFKLYEGRSKKAAKKRLQRPIEVPLNVSGREAGCLIIYPVARQGSEQKHQELVGALVTQINLVLERLEHLKQAERTWLRSILITMVDGVVLLDLERRITAMNPAGEAVLKLFNSRAAVGRRVDKVGPVRLTELARQLDKQAESEPIRREITSRDESHRIFNLVLSELPDLGGKKAGLMMTLRDVTEERELQEQLFMNSKLASLGELAAGVAHEVNNPLTTVVGYAQYHLMADTDPEIREDLRKIYEDGRRAQDIVSSLLSFARSSQHQETDVDLNTTIREVPRILGKQLTLSNIELKLDLQEDLPKVRANSGEILQVLLNLVQNAREAIRDSHCGSTITITTRQNDGCVEIVVDDDGPGIPETKKNQIFEPFFTTKPVGQGTGLGLSICQKIVKKHKGTISVHSRLNEGTRFTIRLPLSKEVAEKA